MYKIQIIIRIFSLTLVTIFCSCFSPGEPSLTLERSNNSVDSIYIDFIIPLKDTIEIEINNVLVIKKRIGSHYPNSLVDISKHLSQTKNNIVSLTYKKTKFDFNVDINTNYRYYNVYYFEPEHRKYFNMKKTVKAMPRF